MKRKIFRKNLIVTLPALVGLWIATPGLAVSDSKKEIPEYTGSQACLACHTKTYVAWKLSDECNNA